MQITIHTIKTKKKTLKMVKRYKSPHLIVILYYYLSKPGHLDATPYSFPIMFPPVTGKNIIQRHGEK